MPEYSTPDEETLAPGAPAPRVDFRALLDDAGITPDAVGRAFAEVLDARDSGVPAGQVLLRGDPATGPAVSRCDACGTERWAGTGECSICSDTTTEAEAGRLAVAAALRDAVESDSATAAPPGPDPTPVPAASGFALGDDGDDRSFGKSVAEALVRIAPEGGGELEAHQLPPPVHDDPGSEVTGWVLQAGRNSGKTYAGARSLHRRCTKYPGTRARIIAPSFGDAVASCVEGPSGVLSASNGVVKWKPSHPGGAQLQWPNGSVCYVLGTPTPRDVDRLRALTNIDFDWFEEAAANPQIEEAERQARLSRRRKGAKWIATTTPRPIKTIREWRKDRRVVVSYGTAKDNPGCDPQWLEELEAMYAGTRLYAQEVLGQVLDDVEGALWRIDHLDRSRVINLAAFYEMLEETGQRVAQAAVGVDPANSTGTTGIVAALITDRRHLYVVEDASQPGRTAEQWARVAVELAVKWGGPIVPENDSGGDAIRAVLKAADLMDQVTIMPATARGRGGKGARAEPIALLWERDDFRGHVVGSLPFLEDQMTTFVPDMPGQDSPDRMDACVWACTYLWSRANFNQVTATFPGTQANTGNASRRRPGAMVRWHRGTKTRNH